MAELVWDAVGARTYQTGVDRGVLYVPGVAAVAWNGLTAVEETSVVESEAHYLDGVKYLQRMTPGDYSAKLKAFTYPDIFDSVTGIFADDSGLSYHEQPPKSFGLSYRTKIGNDVAGTDFAYKIHILYNLIAVPDAAGFETLGDVAKPVEFAWTLTGTPPTLSGHRPTVHFTIDSRTTNPDVLGQIEDIIYGSAVMNPRLPGVDELISLFQLFGSFVVVDNGDGSWTGIDLANDYITMDSPTQFTVDNVDADYIDTDTYTVSTTNP